MARLVKTVGGSKNLVAVMDGQRNPLKRYSSGGLRSDATDAKRALREAITSGAQVTKATWVAAIEVNSFVMAKVASVLEDLGIEFICAPFEADPMCIYLESMGYVIGVISTDSDMFVLGAKTLIIKSTEKEYYIIKRADALRKLGMGPFGLGRAAKDSDVVTWAACVGSDYGRAITNMTTPKNLAKKPSNQPVAKKPKKEATSSAPVSVLPSLFSRLTNPHTLQGALNECESASSGFAMAFSRTSSYFSYAPVFKLAQADSGTARTGAPEAAFVTTIQSFSWTSDSLQIQLAPLRPFPQRSGRSRPSNSSLWKELVGVDYVGSFTADWVSPPETLPSFLPFIRLQLWPRTGTPPVPPPKPSFSGRACDYGAAIDFARTPPDTLPVAFLKRWLQFRERLTHMTEAQIRAAVDIRKVDPERDLRTRVIDERSRFRPVDPNANAITWIEELSGVLDILRNPDLMPIVDNSVMNNFIGEEPNRRLRAIRLVQTGNVQDIAVSVGAGMIEDKEEGGDQEGDDEGEEVADPVLLIRATVYPSMKTDTKMHVVQITVNSRKEVLPYPMSFCRCIDGKASAGCSHCMALLGWINFVNCSFPDLTSEEVVKVFPPPVQSIQNLVQPFRYLLGQK